MQSRQSNYSVSSAPTRVVLVGGGPEVLAYAEPLLPRGAYQIEFVETYEAPYGVIRTKCPDLVVLCLRLDDHDGFQLLSMLRLDPATRHIPVLTYATRLEWQTFESQDEEDRGGHGTTVTWGPALSRH